MSEPLFDLGQVRATPAALDALQEAEVLPGALLARHLAGDWGDLAPEDARENEYSLSRHLRILSAYTLPLTERRLWIITEADRSMTTLILPDEY